MKQRIRVPHAAVLIGTMDIDEKIYTVTDTRKEKKLIEDYQVSGMLEEGEVFCQIEPNSFANSQEMERVLLEKGIEKSLKAKQPERRGDILSDAIETRVKLIKGNVLITKNPCGHEGDIRKAKAIDESHPAFEKLKHLVNVIVFPSKGDRPLQNMMSGGDLDGDVYMIIWD